MLLLSFSLLPSFFFSFYQFQIKLETRTHPLVFLLLCMYREKTKKKKKKLKNVLKNCHSCAHLASSPFSLVMHRLSMILNFSCIPNLWPVMATIPGLSPLLSLCIILIPEIFIHQTSWYIVQRYKFPDERKSRVKIFIFFIINCTINCSLKVLKFLSTLSKLVRKIDIVSIPSTMRRKNNRNKQIRKHVNGICSILLDGKLETVVHACRGKVSADYVYGRLCSLRNTLPGWGSQ